MKHLMITLLLCVGLVVQAPNTLASNIRTRIVDDTKTLSIRIDGQRNGQKIHFSQRYNVVGMNTLQKEALKFRAFNSVGLVMPFHEMPALIFGTFGLLIFISTLLIMRYQAKKGGLIAAK